VGPSPQVAAVRSTVRHVLRELDGPGPVLVACSGGADSVALAAALAFEAPRSGRSGRAAGALTVDHGLQEGSAGRAADLAAALTGLGLDPVEVLSVHVGTTGGPEAAARTARYAALDEAAERLGAAAVLLGHTLDDQAETVLLGLARGSGARSLAGMPAARGRYRRPLLGLERATVRAVARESGVAVWEDPHNADPAFARSRVRDELLPAMEKALGPGVAEALARTADLLRADADALDAWAATALAEAAPVPGRLDVAVLAGLPEGVRRRALRRAVLDAGAPGTDLTAAHVAEVDRLVTDWHGQGPLHLPGGVRVGRDRAMLHLSVDERPG
jgi:tRNA(Ile)-lysidine synthase